MGDKIFAFLYGTLIVVASVGCLGYLVYMPFAKLEICSKYYPEISKLSCLVSHYGIPPRSK